MKNPPVNLKPSVLAVSAIMGLLVSHHAMATGSTVISSSTGNITIASGTSLDVSITSSGTISGNSIGIYDLGTITTLTNSGTIAGNAYGVYNSGGTLGTLTNLNSISGGSYGIYNSNGTISTISNSSTISANAYGINNSGGTIGAIVNSSIIRGSSNGINNASGSIGTITNSGSISGSYAGVYNTATLGTLSNSGTITGNTYAVYNLTTIDNLSNTGTILGNSYGVFNLGHMGTLNNSGSISGSSYGVLNSAGTLTTLTNSGTITGGIGGILNNGGSSSIGTLINSGTIAGSTYAINNGGTIGTLANTGTLLGNIYTPNSLTITGGTGSTIGTLTGYTSNTTSQIGNIIVDDGNLVLGSGNILLNDNVVLSAGSLNNTGSALSVSHAVTISGDYTQSATASLNSNVFSETNYGQLVVNGTASIAASSSINLISQNYSFASGQRYVVIQATTGNYNANNLIYSATGYSGSITGSTVADGSYSDLVLTLGGSSTTNGSGQATTNNAIASLNGLQRYSGTSNAALLNLYDASLAISSTTEGNKAGEQLTPNQNASASSATSAATFDMFNVIGNHLGSMQVAQAGGGSGLSAGDEAPQQAGWGQFFGGHASQSMTDEISGYKANYTGAVVGYDRALSDSWRVGGAFSYTNTNVHGADNVQGSNSRVTSYGLTAYANYTAPKWYSNLYATVVDQRYTTQREVSFTGYNGVANGNFDGQQYAFKAEFGYPIALANNVTLTPVANLSYSHLHQNGYTESGGNGSALQVDSAHSDAIKSGLGAKLETTLPTRWGDVMPYAQLLWNHQYNRSRMAITAAYAADTATTSFTSLGSSPTKDAADLSLGATLLRSRNTSLSAYYDLNIASHYTNQSVSLRIKQLF